MRVGWVREYHPRFAASASERGDLTPPDIASAVLRAFGTDRFCLALASPDPPSVPCHLWFSKEDDGLSRPWHADLAFLHPPYRRLQPWVDKAIREHQRGHTRKIVLLLPARFEPAGMRALSEVGAAMFLLTQHFRSGEAATPAPGEMAIYVLGSTDEELARLEALLPDNRRVWPDNDLTGAVCWYTPKEVMDAIHEVFGPCALDPASPIKPVHVQARKWFTKEDDGLAQSWRNDGWLFLNPPWSRERKANHKPLRLWLEKLRHEMACGNVRKAVVLVPNKRSDAFDALRADGAAIINLGQIKFGGSMHEHRDDSACLLLGFGTDQVDALLSAFLRRGIRRALIECYGKLKPPYA